MLFAAHVFDNYLCDLKYESLISQSSSNHGHSSSPKISPATLQLQVKSLKPKWLSGSVKMPLPPSVSYKLYTSNFPPVSFKEAHLSCFCNICLCNLSYLSWHIQSISVSKMQHDGVAASCLKGYP